MFGTGRDAGGRRLLAMVGAIAMLASLLAASTATGVGASDPSPKTYLLHHLQSDQYLAPDGWGPSVLASHFDGAVAQWNVVDQPDGTVALLNAVTGRYLDEAVGAKQHDVGMAAELSPTGHWELVETAAGTQVVTDGEYLVADGFHVRTTTQADAQATWELIEVGKPHAG